MTYENKMKIIKAMTDDRLLDLYIDSVNDARRAFFDESSDYTELEVNRKMVETEILKRMRG